MPDISQRIDCVTDECAGIIETIKRQQSEQAAYASTLPAQAYNSEAFFEYEMEKVFRTDWLFVGHVSQIPAEGDYFTLNIVKEPLVVIRHQQQVRVMSSVCLHRWVPVVTGEGNDLAP